MATELNMHSKTNNKVPFRLTTLSPYSIHHLKAAYTEGSKSGTSEAKSQETTISVIKCDDDVKFPHFLELPLEIQAKIWKFFIEDQPRVVQLGSFMNEPNILRQLNRQIKEDCLTLHGFVDVDQSKKQERNNNTVFHPQTDLIHLGPNSSGLWGPRSSVRRFAACGALDKIRCVAVMIPTTDLATRILFGSLQEYQNLELVFVVIQISVADSTFGWKNTEWLKFRVVDDQEVAGLPDTQGLNSRWCRKTQNYTERIQGLMAREPRKVAPRVVFVEEIRAWEESISKE